MPLRVLPGSPVPLGEHTDQDLTLVHSSLTGAPAATDGTPPA